MLPQHTGKLKERRRGSNKTLQFLHNNNINNFFYSRMKETNKIVRKSTDEMIIGLFIFKSFSFLFTFLLHLIIIAWNLPGFTIISFILNQSMTVLLFFSNTFMSSSILFLASHIVLSSSEFAS